MFCLFAAGVYMSGDFLEKNRLFCSLTYWIFMTLRDQIRSDPGRICSRVIAWDQALWWGTGEV